MDYYYEFVKFAKSKVSLPYPVHVRRTAVPLLDGKKLDSDCRFDGNRYLIRIDKTLPESVAIDSFVHEFAHVLSLGDEPDAHGPRWGKAYSYVYRLLLEFDDLKK